MPAQSRLSEKPKWTILTVGFCLLVGACAPKYELAVSDVVIVDLGEDDVSFSEPSTILIRDGRIDRICLETACRYRALKTLAAPGHYVTPGLWDMHAHFAIYGPKVAFPAMLSAGILGARDMGWDLEKPIALRSQVETDTVLGPRLFVAGPMLDGPTDGWPLRITVASPDQAEEIVETVRAAGADFVKVHGQLERESFLAVASAARSRGLPVVGHLAKNTSIEEAAAAGQRSFEHLIMPWCSETACPEQNVQDAIDAIRLHNAVVTPTLPIYWHNVAIFGPGGSSVLSDPTIERSVREWWDLMMETNEPFLPPDQAARLAQAKANLAGALRMVKHLADEGVRLMTGCDLGFLGTRPGECLHLEIALMSEAGLSPEQILKAAMIEPPRFLGIDGRVGAVAEGNEADFLVLEANPVADVGNLRKIKWVVRKGEAFVPSAIK